ncbi:MAG TPA: hypothetical protein VI953_04695, partial [Candidatus Paceibacterota bacterium]
MPHSKDTPPSTFNPTIPELNAMIKSGEVVVLPHQQSVHAPSPERPSLTFTAQYRYQDQQGKQIEEEAEFNLDRSLAKWQAFYTKH